MTKQPDGTYRWSYELNMYRNPTVLITVLKVLGISMGLAWLFTVLISMGDRRFWWDGFLSTTKGFALVMLGFIVLGAVSYYLYALIQGGRYCVLFEMDEQGVKHTQLARPFRKSQVVAALLKAVGREDRELTLAQIVALGRTLADNPVHAAAIAANPPPSDLSAARLEIDPETGDVRAWYAIPADTNGAKGLSEAKVAFDLCR